MRGGSSGGFAQNALFPARSGNSLKALPKWITRPSGSNTIHFGSQHEFRQRGKHCNLGQCRQRILPAFLCFIGQGKGISACTVPFVPAFAVGSSVSAHYASPRTRAPRRCSHVPNSVFAGPIRINMVKEIARRPPVGSNSAGFKKGIIFDVFKPVVRWLLQRDAQKASLSAVFSTRREGQF